MAHVFVASIDPVIPVFPTPKSLTRLIDTWLQVRDDLYVEKEMWKISRAINGLARPLLRASTNEQVDRLVAQSFPRYLTLKFGLAKLIMFEFSRKCFWSPEQFLQEYSQACAEAVGVFRERAPSKLDRDRAEMLISAVEGLVLFSQRLLTAGVHGKVRDEQTVLQCFEPFLRADFLLLASFLVLDGEIRRYNKAALELIVEKAEASMTEVEDIILSRNFDFLQQEETTSLEEYLAKRAM